MASPVCVVDSNACERMIGAVGAQWIAVVLVGPLGWWVGRAEAEEGWQLMIEKVPIHEREDREALLSMLGLLASLLMLGRQRFECPREPFL